jgi:hypothetical protein
MDQVGTTMIRVGLLLLGLSILTAVFVSIDTSYNSILVVLLSASMFSIGFGMGAAYQNAKIGK